MAVGSNVEVQALNNFVAVNNLFISGTLTTSGSVSLGSAVYDVDSHLELSSSAGSVVAISASMDFPNVDKSYHIRARNSHLILSSSAGSVVAMSSSMDFAGSDKTYHIKALNSDLILQSTGGNSRVVTSGSLLMANGAIYFRGIQTTDGRLVMASNNTITLQDGAGSSNGTLVAGKFIDYNSAGFTATDLLEFRNSGIIAWNNSAGVNGTKEMRLVTVRYWLPSNQLGPNASGALGLSGTAGATACLTSLTGHLTLSSAFGSFVTVSASLYLPVDAPSGGAHIIATTTPLIFSSTVGSVVALSASQDYVNSDKLYHIRAINSHLILSSTAGSVVSVSGGIMMKGHLSSTLPTSPPTGSVFYVEDLGFLAVYVNSSAKYMRISSGSF